MGLGLKLCFGALLGLIKHSDHSLKKEDYLPIYLLKSYLHCNAFFDVEGM